MQRLKAPTIKTDRIILRGPIMDDLEKFQAAKEEVWGDLQNWMSWASDDEKDIEPMRQHIGKQLDNFNPEDVMLLGIHPINGEFMLATGFHNCGENEYSTGYWVAKKYLGQGYATESCNAILQYLFKAKKARAVHLAHFEGNIKSANVIKKLGFTLDKIDPKSARQFSSGLMLDHYKYLRQDLDGVPYLNVTWS